MFMEPKKTSYLKAFLRQEQQFKGFVEPRIKTGQYYLQMIFFIFKMKNAIMLDGAIKVDGPS